MAWSSFHSLLALVLLAELTRGIMKRSIVSGDFHSRIHANIQYFHHGESIYPIIWWLTIAYLLIQTKCWCHWLICMITEARIGIWCRKLQTVLCTPYKDSFVPAAGEGDVGCGGVCASLTTPWCQCKHTDSMSKVAPVINPNHPEHIDHSTPWKHVPITPLPSCAVSN